MTTFTIEDAVGIFTEYDDSQERARETLQGARVVYAVYQGGGWEGDWWVVFVKDGKWFIESGYHCSCNSPDWTPRETTRAELLEDVPHDDKDRFLECINAVPATEAA